MPEALSTSCDTVPLGLTQVIEADSGMSNSLAYLTFVFLATSRSSSKNLGSGLAIILLSIMPVNDTPSNLSSSVFLVQSEDKN